MKIKVVYPGQAVSTPASTTHHPKLGQLEPGKVFELEKAVADKYIAAGLLTTAAKAKDTTKETKEKEG